MTGESHDDNGNRNHEPGQEPESTEVEGIPGGDSVPVRPVGSPLLSDDAGDAAAPSHGQEKPTATASGLDARKIASIEQTLALIENHLHLPMIFPETEKLREMRENLPEVYQIYLDAAKSDVKSTEIERTAPYLVPDRYARRGQTYGLIATVLVLILVGYCVYAGSTILAGIFGTIDLIALVAVFGANQKPKER